LAIATNDWQAEHWLDSRNNWHERWRGSISAPIEHPDPRWLVKHLPEHAREAIMFRNGIETYKLPETVAALEGQARAF
jgi:hypothetical protein